VPRANTRRATPVTGAGSTMHGAIASCQSGRPVTRALPWLWLIAIAGVPRIAGALLLANPDGDAYSYVEAIAAMRSSMAGGAFSIKDLAGFWLPMYQAICAAGSLLVNNPLYVAKVVSAICGTGTCLLVFLICRRLFTGARGLAYAAFAVAALNPLHIMYSSFSMTDVPYSFLLVGSLFFFIIEDRGVLAALFAMAAGLMRVEAWMLIILIPTLQFAGRRKISPISIALLALAPVICFYIYWAASGNPFDYFGSRAGYIRELLVVQPELRGFSPARIIGDVGRLLYAMNPLVFIASVAAVSLMVRRFPDLVARRLRESEFRVLAVCAFFFSSLCFLVLAYFTNSQPQIWTRYGLVFFDLGIPILIWASVALSARTRRLRRALAALTIAACLAQWGLQLRDGIVYAKASTPQQAVVDYLRAEYGRDPSIRIFCDDSTVRVLSDLPPSAFVSSTDFAEERESFMAGLKEAGVRFLVYSDSKWSTPNLLFPQLTENSVYGPFHLTVHRSPQELHSEVWLYEVSW
jgi:hypothetical protein